MPGDDGKSILDKVEQKKTEEAKDASERIALLDNIVHAGSIDAPYWKKNADTCYFYYWNPHSVGFMGMGGGFYDPSAKNNVGMITEKIPVPIDVQWEPINGWLKMNQRIQTEKLDDDGKCPTIKQFYSKANLSKATVDDKKFFQSIGYSIKNDELKK